MTTMKNSKYIKQLLPMILAVLVVLCGTVIAYMFSRTEVKENEFIPAEVHCVVNKESVSGRYFTAHDTVIAKNAGNINAYLRVRLVSYWVDKEDHIVGTLPSPTVTVDMASGWLKGSDDTYYYTKPIAPGDWTPQLLHSPIVLQTQGTAPDEYYQVVVILGEAIQSLPANAVTDSWHVGLSGDIITSVP